MKIRCIIIDDEPIAVDYLKSYVENMPQLELVATYNRAADSFETITNENIELIFLDIRMPELNGLDFIRTLQIKPEIILTTAYSEYALEGFNLNVTDYLLKPISFERFAQAINKVASKKSAGIEITGKSFKKEFLFLKSGYKSVKVNFNDITHVEGMKEYVLFYTTDGSKYIKNERMKNVEEMLISHNFIRVHKSYLVSLTHIKAFYGNTLEVADKEVPVGRVYKEDLKRYLECGGKHC